MLDWVLLFYSPITLTAEEEEVEEMNNVDNGKRNLP